MGLTNTRDRLAIERQKLNALLEITNSINKNYSIDDLIVQFKNVMKDYIGISKLAFINNQNKWNCMFHYGIEEKCNSFDIDKMLEIKEPILISDTALNGSNFRIFDLILPVLHKDKALSYLLVGGIEEENMISFISEHVGFVQTIANVVSVAIETKTLAKELITKKLEEKDMQMAAEMQKLLLPSDLPSDHLVDVSATYLAKEMVSGDYYDFIRIKENEYVFCIADVSGKGMSAAMLMSNFQATLRANIKYNYDNLTLKELVVELNQSVIQAAKGEKFITFFIGYYNQNTRLLKFVNAGHNYPIMYHKGVISELKSGCTALGIFETLPHLEVGEISLENNTIIVCYTDGIVEVENDKKIQFQTERLGEAIAKNTYLNMKEMNKAIFKVVDAYRGTSSYPDDTALLSLRII